MIKKISSLCLSHINWNIKKRWPGDIQLVPVQVAKRGIKKKAEEAYHVKTLTSKDKDSTIEFLNRLFFRDEPVNMAVKLFEGPNDRCIELEEYVAKVMNDGISVAAVDDSGKFLGVVINALVRRDGVQQFTSIKYPKFQPIQRLLVHLDTECRLWEKVPKSCNVVVEVKIASTDPKWRGRKVFERLAQETDRLAKKHNACAIRMDTTSAFSARAAERLGYKKIYCVLYTDIPDGPRPLPPHIEACVYLKHFEVPEHVVKRGTKKKAEGTYHIKMLTLSDKEEAMKFLIRLFFRDEPVAKAVKLLDGSHDRCVELEEYISLAIADGISIKAVDDNGILAGVVINSFLQRGDYREEERRGAGAIHLVATSLFSARAVQRLGYKKIYSVKYADEPDGPQPDPPHLEAIVFIKLL